MKPMDGTRVGIDRLGPSTPNVAAEMGVVEWFRPGEHERVDAMLAGLQRAGVRRLRTGLSWADYHTPEGPAWYDWLLPRLAAGVDVLPCVTYTPPSLGRLAKSSAPPREPKAYADFLDLVVTRHGAHFDWIELWNEPNNLLDWDWRLDPQWEIFSEMLGAAAYWMRQRGKRTVLGGTCPTDSNWLDLMCRRGVMAYLDAVGLHAFPGTWQADWQGWEPLIAEVRSVLGQHGHEPEIWITETGYSTWRADEARQIHHYLDAASAPVSRAYWYSYQDLEPQASSQEGFHFDERHYHTGLVRADGSGKLLYRTLVGGGIDAARRLAEFGRAPHVRRAEPVAVITGGAGFLGSNLADRLARDGRQVLIYDNLDRPNVEINLAWLKERHGARVTAEIADLRDAYTLRDAVRQASEVFHLAAQVAVTTSLIDPVADFDINARGTLNLLEALRAQPTPPPLIFASTNKVYGKLLDDSDLVEGETRYQPVDSARRTGTDELQPLELYSPYGCSKGAADQYVLDYARVFNLPAAVFRMSCLYGPRQFGTEDQGWVAHFLLSALEGRPITIYGNGKQVRDILFVDDIVEAYLLAQRHMPRVRGRVFNLGGGPGNAVSLLELLGLVAELHGELPEITFGPWRAGDQAYYVSDTRKFCLATGWRPRVGVEVGVRCLYHWLAGRAGRSPQLRQTEGVPA